MKNISVILIHIIFMMSINAQELENSVYHGWNSYELSNKYNSIQIIPDIGGRIIQLEFNGTKLFWENPNLFGISSPTTGLDEKGGWLNYGGEKLWPAPQGWDNDKQWHGPPDPVLDGGTYKSEVIDNNIVYLKSKPDPVSGIQFEREISMIPNTSGINISAIMTNTSNQDIHWGIWSNAQLDGSHNGKLNEKFKVYAPINPNSKFVKGYGVLFGLVRNPQWIADKESGLMTIHYKYQVGKAVLDSDAGWLASVNGETGNVFIQKFDFEKDKEYPDHSSIAVWTNGVGSFYAWDKTNTMVDDSKENPYMVESEIISPYSKLKTNEKYEYKYQWFTANIGGDFPVIDVKENVIISKLDIIKTNSGLKINARIASFREGVIEIKSGNKVIKSYSIDPKTPVVIEEDTPLNDVEIIFETKHIKEKIY